MSKTVEDIGNFTMKNLFLRSPESGDTVIELEILVYFDGELGQNLTERTTLLAANTTLANFAVSIPSDFCGEVRISLGLDRRTAREIFIEVDCVNDPPILSARSEELHHRDVPSKARAT